MKHNQLERKQRYGIRKFTVGAASVVIGAVVFGASPVLAQESTTTNKETTELGVEKDQAEKAVDTEKSATESNGGRYSHTYIYRSTYWNRDNCNGRNN